MKPENRIKRFFSKFTKKEGCWEWEGGLTSTGYGCMKIDGKAKTAHRMSWELNVGPIPPGMFICHTCDNPKCVRPDHLFLGTPADNSADMVAKLRNRRGTDHGRHKLTEDQVRFIRDSKLPSRYLAKQFHIARSLIYTIKRRIIWSHLQ